MRVFTSQASRLVAGVLLLVACRVGPGEEKDKGGTSEDTSRVEDSDSGEETDSDSGVEGDTDTDSESDSDTDSDSDADTDSDTDSDTDTELSRIFLVLDWTNEWWASTNGWDYFLYASTHWVGVSYTERGDCPDCDFAFETRSQAIEDYRYGRGTPYYGVGFSALYDGAVTGYIWADTHESEPFWSPAHPATFDAPNLKWYERQFEAPGGIYIAGYVIYTGSGTVYPDGTGIIPDGFEY